MTDKDYSLDAFNKFLDNAATKGYMNRNTAQGRKAAANKVLTILDPTELMDLRTVDIDRTFDRFQNLQGLNYTPDSLQIYLSRAKSAVGEFISWVDNPSAYKMPKPQKAVTRAKNNSNNGNSDKTANKVAENRQLPETNPVQSEQYQESRHIVVPIPLRENLIVKISNLPADLTPSEADRLAAIVKAFAVTSVE